MLAISLVGLTPTIPRGVFAAFILVVAAESAISPIRSLQARSERSSVGGAALVRLLTALTLTASLIVTGVTLAVGWGGGLFWLPASFVIAVVVAAVNAWVLLVEVVR